MCDVVPVAITGTYELDIYGNWNSEANFQQNMSMFAISFQASEISEEEYSKSISKFANRIAEIGYLFYLSCCFDLTDLKVNLYTDKILQKKDTTITAVAWSVFYVKDDSTRMSIKTTADWTTIFSGFDMKNAWTQGFTTFVEGAPTPSVRRRLQPSPGGGSCTDGCCCSGNSGSPTYQCTSGDPSRCCNGQGDPTGNYANGGNLCDGTGSPAPAPGGPPPGPTPGGLPPSGPNPSPSPPSGAKYTDTCYAVDTTKATLSKETFGTYGVIENNPVPNVDFMTSDGHLRLEWALKCGSNLDPVVAGGSNCHIENMIQPCGNLFTIKGGGTAMDSTFQFKTAFDNKNGFIIQQQKLTISLDMRSLLIAFGINVGLLSFEDLQIQDTPILINGKATNIVQRNVIDPMYPSAGQVVCWVLIGETIPVPVCGYRDGTATNHFFYPIFDTFFLDKYDFPAALNSTKYNCDCSRSDGHGTQCQNFNFNLRVLTWPHAPDEDADLMPTFGSFPIGWDSDPIQYLREWFREGQHNLTALCPVSTDCMMFTVLLGGNVNAWLLNGYGLSLRSFAKSSETVSGHFCDDYSNPNTCNNWRGNVTKISCKPSMYHSETWETVMTKPPTPVIAPYFTCRMNMNAAIQNTIGNANNIATAIASVVLSIFLGLAVARVNNRKTTTIDTQIVSTSEKLHAQTVAQKMFEKSTHLMTKALKAVAIRTGSQYVEEVEEFLAFEEKRRQKIEAMKIAKAKNLSMKELLKMSLVDAELIQEDEDEDEDEEDEDEEDKDKATNAAG